MRPEPPRVTRTAKPGGYAFHPLPMDGIYLDYNGSAPLDPRVAEVMASALTEGLGNASAIHRFGRRQAAVADEAREQVASMVGGRASGVIFTSGATEANNLVLRGAVEGRPSGRHRILISAVEHASVSRTAAWLQESEQTDVDIIPVTPGGFVDPDQLRKMVGPDVLLVSVMAANSETGVLNPVGEIAERAHAEGALFHCDATQFAGRLPFDMEKLGADFVSVSSHKICGPTGAGALIGTRSGLKRLRPILHGGGHERGLRSGSLNVTGILGFGAAARIAAEERAAERAPAERLRDQLVGRLRERLPEVHELGDTGRRLPNTACLRFAGADGQAVAMQMDPVAVSLGSACHSGSIEPSATLVAMGIPREAAFEAVRFSVGRFTTGREIELAVERTVTAVEFVRGMER